MTKKECTIDSRTNMVVCCAMDEKGKQVCEERDQLLRGKGKWKYMLLFFAMISLILLLPALAAFVDNILGISGPTDIEMYQQENTIIYSYENGSADAIDIIIDIDPDGSYTDVEIDVDGDITAFQVDYDTGKVKGEDKYTLFWVESDTSFFTVLDALNAFENEYDLIDPAGLLGVKNGNYTMKVTGRDIYFPEEPEMLGAQASITIEIFKAVTGERVGKGFVDITGGNLELLDGSVVLEMKDPGVYPISRHRLVMIPWAIGVAVVIPVLVYFILNREEFPDEEAETISLLFVMGGLAMLVDAYLDAWFYAVIGESTMMLLHIFVIGIFVIILLRLKMHPLYTAPAIFEVVTVLALFWVTGTRFAPYYVAIPGIFVTFLIVVFRLGANKKDVEDFGVQF